MLKLAIHAGFFGCIVQLKSVIAHAKLVVSEIAHASACDVIQAAFACGMPAK